MSGEYTNLSRQPIALESTRVWRTYSGGKKLEEWEGYAEPQDGELPEEWISSVVTARNAGREHIADEGLSKIVLSAGEKVTLKEVIDSDPIAFLGAGHVRKYGSNTAVLVKVLDSRCRLSIQVHPDREYARDVFHSQFGKTEAWYILGGRKIDGQEPYLLFGFKPGITKERWQELFDKQDIQGMVDCLHKLPVIPGETLLIEGGLPHAIGSGCFLVEIQEPTDYTIRVERTTPEGKTIPDSMCHQGVGFAKIFDCFHYDAYNEEETLRRWRIGPSLIRQEEGFHEWELVGRNATDKFRLNRLEITGQLDCQSHGTFSTLVVIAGSGRIIYQDGQIPLQQSSQVFLPEGLNTCLVVADQGSKLEIMRCFPPD